MKYLVIIFSLLIFACESQDSSELNHLKSDLILDLMQDFKEPTCPENHTDSIVNIVYGYPSEELFAKADSGLVALGGCELADENYFCKIHKVSF